jgi:PAS domain S-box-containing protein
MAEGLSPFRKMIKLTTAKVELMFKHKNGTTRWCVVEVVKLSKTRFLGFTKDITEHKIAEQALKVSEEKYKTLLNASPDGILIINLKGVITEVSEIGLELLGAENRDELIGQYFFRFVPIEEKKIITESIEKTLSEGIVQNVELKIKKKNQSLFLSEISLTLIQSPDPVFYSFMITIRDISQRKKMEKKQIHADRMVNLGEMASGIAHEINQPLNTLSLVVDNIWYEATKNENIGKEYLKKKSKKIFENITRIKNIIDHIRAFSRINDDYILSGFDINSSINNSSFLVSKVLTDN